MGDFSRTELRRMQDLSQRVAAARPELVNGDATVGELAWVWGMGYDTYGSSWRRRLWFDDDRVAAWGWARLPYRIPRGDGTFRETKAAELVWQTDPDRPELIDEVLDWYDEVAGGVERTLTVQVADARARERVQAHGFAFDDKDGGDDGHWLQSNERDLVEVPDPVLPEGFRFVTADDVPVAGVVEAHRDAWPNSQFSEAGLERVRGAWPYRGDLHVLVEAPDGTLAASAIIWLDEVTRTAEFEPVGTHVDFRRRGLGSALQLHGMHRAKAAGAERMMVACLGAPAHPSARGLYYGVGFREFTRDLPYVKTAG